MNKSQDLTFTPTRRTAYTAVYGAVFLLVLDICFAEARVTGVLSNQERIGIS